MPEKTAPGVESLYFGDISRIKSLAGHVVVSFHRGTEKAANPHHYQIATAHRAIDAGADLVIGHHPHVLQGIELYKNGVVFYSLGNFTFGSMSRSSDVGAIAGITLENGIKEVEVIPLDVLNSEIRFQPKILTRKRTVELINRLNHLSKPFGTKIYPAGGRCLVVKTSAK